MNGFDLISKDVILRHIVPQLLYCDRLNLFKTCKRLYEFRTGEYIFGEFHNTFHDTIHMIDGKETAILQATNRSGSVWVARNNLQVRQIWSGRVYYMQHHEEIDRKLIAHWKQFGAVGKKRKKKSKLK